MPCPYHTLNILWTPVSTGVTTFYENIIYNGLEFPCRLSVLRALCGEKNYTGGTSSKACWGNLMVKVVPLPSSL